MKKSIIITGASKGIGRFLSSYFLEKGDTIIKISRSNHLDILNYGAVEYFINSIDFEGTEIILINCAGINYNSYCHKADNEKWQDVIYTNLVGSFNMTKAILPIMRKAGYGRIIYFGSVVSQAGIAGTSAYAASKAGLIGLAKSVAVENASKGITVNCINLGYFDIGMIKEVPKEIQDEIIKKIPVGKLGEPAEILKLVEYIIDAGYLTGTSIDLNGGLM